MLQHSAQPLRPHLHIRSGMREPVTGGHQPIRGQLCMARTNERAGECHQSWDCHLSPPRTMGPGIPDRQLTLSIMGAGALTKQESQSELDSLYFFLFRNTGIMGFKKSNLMQIPNKYKYVYLLNYTYAYYDDDCLWTAPGWLSQANSNGLTHTFGSSPRVKLSQHLKRLNTNIDIDFTYHLVALKLPCWKLKRC